MKIWAPSTPPVSTCVPLSSALIFHPPLLEIYSPQLFPSFLQNPPPSIFNHYPSTFLSWRHTYPGPHALCSWHLHVQWISCQSLLRGNTLPLNPTYSRIPLSLPTIQPLGHKHIQQLPLWFLVSNAWSCLSLSSPLQPYSHNLPSKLPPMLLALLPFPIVLSLHFLHHISQLSLYQS